jgi:hypothetical protein
LSDRVLKKTSAIEAVLQRCDNSTSSISSKIQTTIVALEDGSLSAHER